MHRLSRDVIAPTALSTTHSGLATISHGCFRSLISFYPRVWPTKPEQLQVDYLIQYEAERVGPQTQLLSIQLCLFSA